MAVNDDISVSELNELIVLVKQVHGFDFSNYTKASLKRRVLRIIQLKKLAFWDLKNVLVNDPHFFQEFLDEITVNVTEMFRDPTFYKALNTQVLPYLATFPHIKIWSAGCSSGEEAYSLAILMQEAGLKNKSFIYGTDINVEMLAQAKKGIYSLRNIKSYAENYKQAGLPGTLSDHFTIMYDAASIHNELKRNTLFSVHNLISDNVFNEFQMITCRNVFIYFDSDLQDKILEVFYNSLCNLGFLCLGSKETIRSEYFRKRLKVVNSRENIYQKLDNKPEDILLKRLNKAEIVILAGSAGSFVPIFDIIKMLPSTYKKAIVIVIHRGKNNFSDIENLFGLNCRILVREISDKDKITGGHVYIAPANYHTLFEKGNTFALDVSEQVWYSKPSIDVTFESAADTLGNQCAAILFSGANQDGATGLLKLRNKGALTIVQKPSDAEMNMMPQAAVDIDAAEFILASKQILNLMRETCAIQAQP